MSRLLVTAALAIGFVSSAFAQDYSAVEKAVEAQPTAAVRTTAKDLEELNKNIEALVPKLVTFIQSGKVEITNVPYSRYFRYEPGTAIEVEVGFPIKEATQGEGDVVGSELPAGNVVMTTHLGDYEKIGDAYTSLHTWITTNQKEITGGPWESYVKSGNTPEENVTEVYFPIK